MPAYRTGYFPQQPLLLPVTPRPPQASRESRDSGEGRGWEESPPWPWGVVAASWPRWGDPGEETQARRPRLALTTERVLKGTAHIQSTFRLWTLFSFYTCFPPILSRYDYQQVLSRCIAESALGWPLKSLRFLTLCKDILENSIQRFSLSSSPSLLGPRFSESNCISFPTYLPFSPGQNREDQIKYLLKP